MIKKGQITEQEKQQLIDGLPGFEVSAYLHGVDALVTLNAISAKEGTLPNLCTLHLTPSATKEINAFLRNIVQKTDEESRRARHENQLKKYPIRILVYITNQQVSATGFYNPLESISLLINYSKIYLIAPLHALAGGLVWMISTSSKMGSSKIQRSPDLDTSIAVWLQMIQQRDSLLQQPEDQGLKPPP
jgi:hypothetical protein